MGNVGTKIALAAQGVALAACSTGSATPAAPGAGAANAFVRNAGERYVMQPDLPTPIQHVIIIVQENRTPDFLFQGLPNADISDYATDSHGNRVQLRPTSLASFFDPAHNYQAFLTDWDNGKMDGFDIPDPQVNRFAVFRSAVTSEVQPYLDLAGQYVFADHMFGSGRGPSFPAHLYLVSGTSGDPTMSQYRVSGNPSDSVTGKESPGGCDAPKSVVVHTIATSDGSSGPKPWACFEPVALSDLLDERGISWRYYQEGSGPGLWHAFNAIHHVRYGRDWANVVPSSARIITNIKRGGLADVSWVMPAGSWSDHSGHAASTRGPSWVAAIVNAVGKSKYWKTTTILVTWDDWGGWYDHVAPPSDNAFELGFRVPLLVISPYAKQGYVSKVQHEFGSLLAYTEVTFGIPKGSLYTTDVRADDLNDCFDFTQRPRSFVPVSAPPFKATINPDPYVEDP